MATLDDFVSFLQGASNSAASNLSAPVDGINWLLGKAGLPVSKAPVGGSDWLRQAGFTAEPKNRNAGLLGEFVGGVMPIVSAAKAPQIAAWLNQAGRNLSAPRTLNPQAGILNVNGMPNRGRDFIQKSADDLAEVLNKKGFKATVQHSGSAGGPSSYVSIFDPQTGRFINDPVRFSGHTKGVFNSQSIHDISGPEDVQKIIDLAQSMRDSGPTAMWINQLKGQ